MADTLVVKNSWAGMNAKNKLEFNIPHNGLEKKKAAITTALLLHQF